MLARELVATGHRSGELAEALLPRLLRVAERLPEGPRPRAAAARATARTLDLIDEHPDGRPLHAGHDGWTGPAIVALGLLELAAALGRQVDLLAAPRVALPDRAALALVGVDGLSVDDAAVLLDTSPGEVRHLLRRGLDHVGQPWLDGSTCPAWRSVAASLTTATPEPFVAVHRDRCDPCNTLACLHVARRRQLAELPGLASLYGLGRAWSPASVAAP